MLLAKESENQRKGPDQFSSTALVRLCWGNYSKKESGCLKRFNNCWSLIVEYVGQNVIKVKKRVWLDNTNKRHLSKLCEMSFRWLFNLGMVHFKVSCRYYSSAVIHLFKVEFLGYPVKKADNLMECSLRGTFKCLRPTMSRLTDHTLKSC